MRSLLGLIVPVLVLSFHVVACGEDESEPQAPAQQTQQSELVAAGGACDTSADCQSGLTCELAASGSIGIRGEPAMPSPCELDPNDSGCAKTKGKPAPGGAPSTTPSTTPSSGDPQPSGAPSPSDEPIATRFCAAR